MNWGSTWDFLWHFLIIFAWIAYLLVLFQILTDLFWRDHKTSGVVKAIWVDLPDPDPVADGVGLPDLPRPGHGRTSARGRRCGQKADRRLHPAGCRTVAGRGDRARKGAARRGHHQPGRVRLAEGQGAQLGRKHCTEHTIDQSGWVMPASLIDREIAEHQPVEKPGHLVDLLG